MSVRRVCLLTGALVWLVLIVAARRAGLEIAETPRVAVGAAPLVGRWLWSPNSRFVWPVLIAVLSVVGAPRVVAVVSWRRLLLLVTVLAAAWTTSLAMTEGSSRLTDPLETRYEYLAVLPAVDDVGIATFLSTYTERLGDYPTHVKGHPPGPTLVFVGLDRIGLGGSGWATAFVIAFGASSAAAVLVALRQVADEPAARRAAPFLALMPGAVWVGTSADALFAGVIAWAIALTAVATHGDPARQRVLGAAAGSCVAAGLFMTYGAVPLLLVPIAVVVSARAWKVMLPAVAGAAAVTLAFALGGFWWFDGVEATRSFYEAGVSQRRDAGYFVLLGNPAAFALAIGPAAAAALVALRDRRVWVLVGSALGAVIAADLSGLSKGEVERIWLPYVPWIVAATSTFARTFSIRLWLGLQVTSAIVIEAWLISPW